MIHSKYPGGDFQGMGPWNTQYFNNGQDKLVAGLFLNFPFWGQKQHFKPG
jgi:hypothetical protein